MNRVALNFICKNESHIIRRMLQSALPAIDMIVCVDTGSTDNTIAVIEAFGQEHQVPTFVYQRPFDNFCNSRNYALQMLRGKAVELGWDLATSWAFTADCDETVKILPGFSKAFFTADMYIVKMIAGQEFFNRQVMWRLSAPIEWEGPIHERLVSTGGSVTRELHPFVEVVVDPAGASWQGDLVAKFLNYAEKLRAWVEDGHRNFRWCYYVGDSYTAAARYCKDAARRCELQELALQFFEDAILMEPENVEGLFFALSRIGEMKEALGRPWGEIKREYLKALNVHPGKGETMAKIIEHYMATADWETGWQYSSYALKRFEGKGKNVLATYYTDSSLYNWKFLYFAYITAWQTGRKVEASKFYKKLQELIKHQPGIFDEQDRWLVKLHSPSLLRWHQWRNRVISIAIRWKAAFIRKPANAKPVQSRNNLYPHAA